jgi:hypothetical protein
MVTSLVFPFSLSLSLSSQTHTKPGSLRSRTLSLSLSLFLFGAGAYLGLLYVGLLCVCEIRYKHGEVKASEVPHSITRSNWVTFQSAPQSPKTTALLQSNKS